MGKENLSQPVHVIVSDDGPLPVESEDPGTYSRYSLDKEAGVATCRVCQCIEIDKRGDAALGFLGIIPPLQQAGKSTAVKPEDKDQTCEFHNRNAGTDSTLVEFISPDGEVFICNIDLEMGSCHQQDSLIELGCSCKNDLALVHYACALKWFLNHGSTICEICGRVAKNVRTEDIEKVVVSLKDYEALRERTATGDPDPVRVHTSSGVDPDAIAAIRRQRLSEISLWFRPLNNSHYNNSAQVSEVVSQQPPNTDTEGIVPSSNPATRWAVECTGILFTAGLLTVTLAWLIAPHVGKKTARSGLHFLLGGICALTIVIFFRFFVLTRIRCGRARYWVILFVFWFLVFGIWVSQTHSAHKT